MSMVLMTTTGSVALILKWISFGASTKFGTKYIIAPSSRLILLLAGVQYKLPRRSVYPNRQVMYTFNHNSYLDVLILTAMGIPNTRFFLSETTFKFIHLTISAMAIGVHYIPMKSDPARRAKFFKEVEKDIMQSGHSVFVSSEGVHEFIHGIAPFNRGVYHMAMNCGMDIQLVYLDVPKKMNALNDYKFNNGTVEAYLMEFISTKDWSLDVLDDKIDSIRERFLKEYSLKNDLHS